MVSMMDMSNKYNTELTPEEDEEFLDWVKVESLRSGRDVSRDIVDYDLAGFWKEQGPVDTYKKPNHITFNASSKYNKDTLDVGEEE